MPSALNVGSAAIHLETQQQRSDPSPPSTQRVLLPTTKAFAFPSWQHSQAADQHCADHAVIVSRLSAAGKPEHSDADANTAPDNVSDCRPSR